MLLPETIPTENLQVSDGAEVVVRTHPLHEQLLRWAADEWQRRYPDTPYLPVWSESECSNQLALQRVKVGRRVKGNARYMGYTPVISPYVNLVNVHDTVGRREVLTSGAGAFVFTFSTPASTFEILYAAAYKEDSWCGYKLVAIALVPPEYLRSWADFETLCYRAVYRLERSNRVYIVGGEEDSFQPNIDWDDVILPEALKSDLLHDAELFFTRGAKLYQQLNLTPFRKLLLVGPPGTGKSMICAALARLALSWKCLVVYVSSSAKEPNEQEGNTFSKIQYALRLAANSHYPVLLIVEELDIYLRPQDKSQILNVLDGFETRANNRGTLLIATTNYPEMIDERILRRPGRIDRIIHIPAIVDLDQALRMLKHYLGPTWDERHGQAAPDLVGQTGAFVREVAVYARLSALQQGQTEVSLEMLQQSIRSLREQVGFDEESRIIQADEYLELASD